MSTTASIYPVLLTDDVPRLHAFYARLLGLDDTFVSDWYVSLAAAGDPDGVLVDVVAVIAVAPEDAAQYAS